MRNIVMLFGCVVVCAVGGFLIGIATGISLSERQKNCMVGGAIGVGFGLVAGYLIVSKLDVKSKQ